MYIQTCDLWIRFLPSTIHKLQWGENNGLWLTPNWRTTTKMRLSIVEYLELTRSLEFTLLIIGD